MKSTHSLKKELSEFSKLYFKDKDYFVCIYGSIATNDQKEDSDLDIFFASSSFTKKDFTIIHAFILHIHKKYNLLIDEEVPYSNKLLLTYDDILKSSKLFVFHKPINNSYYVPKIQNTYKYLSSPETKQRLILNIFTTPNIFVAGNRVVYKKFKTGLEKALIELAKNLSNEKNITKEEIYKVLTRNKDGERDQAHLGYKIKRRKVLIHLKGIIKKNH